MIYIDEREMASFIQEKLVSEKGVIVTEEDIMLILQYEMAFMKEKGVIEE